MTPHFRKYSGGACPVSLFWLCHHVHLAKQSPTGRHTQIDPYVSPPADLLRRFKEILISERNFNKTQGCRGGSGTFD